MVELKKIKITKKLYKFEIKKKYFQVRYYKIKEKKFIEKIGESISKIFASQKQKKAGFEAYSDIEKQQRGFNTIILSVAIIFAFLAIAGVWLYLTVLSIPVITTPINESFKPYITVDIVNGDIITAGNIYQNEHVAYVTLHSLYKGLKNFNVTLSLYREKPSFEIFLIKSEREIAETKLYPNFIKLLRKNLQDKEIAMSEINFAQLETLPKGAIVLIPTGSIPEEILGINSNIKIRELMERGVVFIYIGKAFTTSILHGSTLLLPPPGIVEGIGFSFTENIQLTVDEKFHLQQPRYKATGISLGAGGRVENRLQYGFLSIVKIGEGAFVFVPQTLDGGWEDDAVLAVEDVTKIITETPWMTLINMPITYVFNETKNLSEYVNIFSNQIDQTSIFPSSAKIEIIATTIDAEKKEIIEMIPLQKKTPGELYVEEGVSIAPTDITGKTVRMTAKPNSQVPEERFLYLMFTQGGKEVGEKEALGSRNTQTESTLTPKIHLDSGEYVAHLVDDEETEYAATYLKVVAVDIKYTGSEEGAKYSFSIEKDGKPKKIENIVVKVNGGKYGNYSFSGVSKITVDVLKFTGPDGLPQSKTPYEFTFIIGKLKKNIPISIPKKTTIIDEPLFQASVVFSIVILGIGFYFARKEPVIYLLDIPDFPPLSRIKIPITKETVKSVFEKVNDDYKWKCTPLTIAEIKNGFKKIFHKGKPIFISDYNAQYILHELIQSNEIEEYMNYYGLSDWEEKSNYSVKYLAVLRKMRDICVNNAVHFTQLGESKISDSKITCIGQEMYVHIYDSNSPERVKKIAKGILATIRTGINIILFITQADKKEFEMFFASSSQAFLILKLEYEGRSLLLLTIDEFEKMIRELQHI